MEIKNHSSVSTGSTEREIIKSWNSPSKPKRNWKPHPCKSIYYITREEEEKKKKNHYLLSYPATFWLQCYHLPEELDRRGGGGGDDDDGVSFLCHLPPLFHPSLLPLSLLSFLCFSVSQLSQGLTEQEKGEGQVSTRSGIWATSSFVALGRRYLILSAFHSNPPPFTFGSKLSPPNY